MNLRTITLIGPSGASVTLGALTYANGASGYTLERADLSPAERRLTTAPLPLVTGEVVSAGRHGARRVSLGGTVVGTDRSAVQVLRAKLVGIVADQGSSPVVVRYRSAGEDMELAGYLDGTVSFGSTGGAFVTFDLELLCPDPVARSVEPEELTLTSGTTRSASNRGNYTTQPLIELTPSGTVTRIRVRNSVTGEQLDVAGLTSGTIEIDCRPGLETIRQNGVQILAGLTDTSRFLSLVPGVNRLLVTVVTGTGTLTGTLTYRHGWID
jgi:phage-related protein